MPRPYVLPCSIFGGRSPKTGEPVGMRHRWPGAWGEGRCIYCRRTLQEVLKKESREDRIAKASRG